MAKTASITTRIDPETRDAAETILSKLGITRAQAINMFYKMIITKRGLPFQPQLEEELDETTYILNNPEMMRQFEKSMETHKAGTGYRPTPEELDEINSV